MLDELDLTLEPGTTTWVGGRNGVGKTTMLRVAAGLIDPDSGRAEVWGVAARVRTARATSGWSRSCPPAIAACMRG